MLNCIVLTSNLSNPLKTLPPILKRLHQTLHNHTIPHPSTTRIPTNPFDQEAFHFLDAFRCDPMEFLQNCVVEIHLTQALYRILPLRDDCDVISSSSRSSCKTRSIKNCYSSQISRFIISITSRSISRPSINIDNSDSRKH